jgi:hypothetical protein
VTAEKVLTVYSRPGCHLCEEMWRQLQGLQREIPFLLALVDVDEIPEMRMRYATRVPVLAHADRVLCELFLDEARVREYLCNGVNGV